MRSLTSLLMAGVVLASAASAFALPPIPHYLAEAVGGKEETKGFATAVEGLKSKCDVCHKPGADKKGKGHGLNDFGLAFKKHLNDKAFMAAHKEKNTAEATKLFTEAWGKVVDDKNAAGETFGSLIKAGKLPGKND